MAKKATYKLNYYDETGRRRGKTFTASSKSIARQMAHDWEDAHLKEKHAFMSLLDAFNEYIDLKAPVLSPSTIRGYRGIVSAHVEGDALASKDVASLTLSDVQKWVNAEVMQGLSPKTVKDHYSFFRSVVEAQTKHIDFDAIALPQQRKYSGHTPTDEEVKALIEYTRKQADPTLYRAILLAAFGPLRRSEVCALTSSDIDGNNVVINKAIVKDQDGSWVTKTTKTVESTRVITYPDFVIKELSGISGKVVDCNPDALARRFERALRFAKLPHFRFHDLRHYGASIMHALGVPDVYIMQRGGWSTDYVMKRIYINALSDEQKRQNNIINSHFSQLV